MAARPLALVTGASTGIGLELARCCAENGFDLVIAADEPEINRAAAMLRETGVEVWPVEADLAALDGVEKLCLEGPELYKTFRDKQDGCVKVVMTP